MNYAIDLAVQNALRVDPQTLSALYMHRMRCFEALDLHEHAKADYKKVLEADPGFI